MADEENTPEIQNLVMKLDERFAKLNEKRQVLEKAIGSDIEELKKDQDEARKLRHSLLNESADISSNLEAPSQKIANVKQRLNQKALISGDDQDQRNDFSVLIVDDDRTVQETNRRFMMSVGKQKQLRIEFQDEKNGKEAVYLHLSGASFDLILMDNQMPIMNGIQGSFQAYALGEVFHVPEAFDPDYEEMERKFNIFDYPHNTTYCCQPRTLDGQYGNEGLFYLNLNWSQFLTKDPEKRRSEDERDIALEDFVKSIISKYPYCNRTLGADHFVTCANINVTATASITKLMKNSIRVMCTPSYNDEYVPQKNVSLQQSVSPHALTPAGNNIANRMTLAFWRDLNNSKIRQKLLEAWGNDLELFIEEGRKPSLEERDLVYHETFNKKYCLCPGGLEIHYGCVPDVYVSATGHTDSSGRRTGAARRSHSDKGHNKNKDRLLPKKTNKDVTPPPPRKNNNPGGDKYKMRWCFPIEMIVIMQERKDEGMDDTVLVAAKDRSEITNSTVFRTWIVDSWYDRTRQVVPEHHRMNAELQDIIPGRVTTFYDFWGAEIHPLPVAYELPITFLAFNNRLSMILISPM